jgi:hypothetical protein
MPKIVKRGKTYDLKKSVVATRVYKNTSFLENARLVDVNKPLTEQQKRFTKFWAEGDTIPNSCLRAGYAQETIGYRMVVMPNVLALRNKICKQFEEASRMTKKKVMDMLMESYDMAKLMAEPATMVSAAREVGKLCGYYEPKKVNVNVSVSGSVTMRELSGMSDSDLLKVIEGGMSAEAELLEDRSGGDKSEE